MATATGRRSRPATGWRDTSSRLPPGERELLRARHPNLLVVGSIAATSAVVNELEPFFRAPIITWTAGRSVTIPLEIPAGTLILNDAASLSPAEQERLLSWLRRDNGATQVVATTSIPLLPLVESGQFDDALYYSLNVVYLEVSE
jgi:transcriptional regulator of acetoin/glycerol metabolism